MNIISKSIFVVVVTYGFIFSQPNSEHISLFKLGPTPSVHKSKFGMGLNYSLNYGQPGYIIGEWSLPNEEQNIHFMNFEGFITYSNRLLFRIKHTKYDYLSFASSHTGDKFKESRTSIGIKWKVINTDNLYPDVAIDLNTLHPLSISLGSTDYKFKYFLGIDFFSSHYYLIYPYIYSAGISYELFENINIFLETSYKTKADGLDSPNNAYRSGFSITMFDYFTFDFGVFYFSFNFEDSIPSRDLNQTGRIEVPEKEDYLLFSGSFNINLGLLK